MVKQSKPAARRSRTPSKTAKMASGELLTLLDFVRYAASRFREAKLVFAHGTTDPMAEAAFLVCEALHLHPDQFEMFAAARVTVAEAERILDLIARRVSTRQPAAYLVNKIYMRGLPFYVDERTIVPRSFIGELLDSHFGGDEEAGGSLIHDPATVESVLDLCTGSGCLAILAEPEFSQCRNRCGRHFKGRARGRRAQCRRLRPGGPPHAVPGDLFARSATAAMTLSSPIHPMWTR